MNTSLHARHRDIPDVSDHELSRVADGGGLREVRDFLVGYLSWRFEFVGEGAEARAQHQRNAGAESGFAQDEFGGARGVGEFRAGNFGRHVRETI
jgi:hypothetical protein